MRSSSAHDARVPDKLAAMTRASWTVLALLTTACATTTGSDDAGSDARSTAPDAGGDTSGSDAGRDAGSDGGLDAATPPARTFVYVGLTSGDLLTLDPATLTEVSRTRTGDFPSFVAASADGAHLYVVNETANEVVSLDVSVAGVTTVTGRQPAPGGPTHVAIDHAERHVFVASYGSGHVHVYTLDAAGAITTPASTDDTTCAHNAHEAVISDDDALLYVPCLGDDAVQVRHVAATGALSAASTFHTAVGAGPRHLAFSRDRRFAYVLDELGSTLDVASVAASGALTSVQTITTLPAGFTGTNACAEVLVSEDDTHVYASNRGHDSVAVFSRDATTGRVTLLEHEPTGGMHPRSMTLSPGGARLLVADRDSSVLVVLDVAADGRLSPSRSLPQPGRPYFVGEFPAP
jgi:6-phosphogluconolactonase